MSRLPVPGPFGSIDYGNPTPPVEYRCGKCGIHGVKMWRDYQTFRNHQSLLCGSCACVEQSNDERRFEVHEYAFGHVEVNRIPDPHNIGDGDQIGWRIPAVPTEDGETFWGYTSVPEAGVSWWKRLPLRTPGPGGAS